ncbi:MAG: metallophosphoesterase [Planctomycetia bacterium]|nr:metallophosphoesterase [Planctomycetia bacterium]
MDDWFDLPDGCLGLLSDTHGRADRTTVALDRLLEAGATTILHLGDIGSEQVIDRLAGLPVHLLFGNVDEPRTLVSYAIALGLRPHHPTIRFRMGGQRIIGTHGDRSSEIETAFEARPDYLLHGHTHVSRDETIEGVRVLNPVAIHRAKVHTVATLEPASGRFTVLEIP